MEGRTFDGQVVLMAKSVYKISASMDMSMLDNDLAIRSSTGVGLRPLPIKFVFGWIFSALILFWMVVSGPVSDMGIVFKILFVILWIITSVVLLKMDKSKTLGMARIPILMGYMPRAARRVPCRTDDNAGPFATITNLKSIDEDTGTIHFEDGDLGFAYRITGTASVMLFPEDRDAILDRVDMFFRNMKSDYEIIFITVKEAQNVKRQVANMDKRIERLRYDDKDLLALAEMERYYLTDAVGGHFRSIHQYMIIKADGEESLQTAHQILEGEVENSTLMIKRCAMLFDDELHAVFRSVFKGKESL